MRPCIFGALLAVAALQSVGCIASGGRAEFPVNSETTVPVDKTSVTDIDESTKSIAAEAARAMTSGTDIYIITGPDCHQKPSQLQTFNGSVPAGYQITSITQECVSGPCGWSYNPLGANAPGGDNYAIWYELTDGGTKFQWRRLHTSHPVTYRVYVNWKTVK